MKAMWLSETGLLVSLSARLMPETHGMIDAQAITAMRPGAVLVREWRGISHQVSVLEKGFCFRGKHYRSLSGVAHKITGTRWSGPLFFGLKRSQEERRDGTL